LARLASPAFAQLFKKTDELLEPEKAFRFSARALDGAIEVKFAIADGYYLYRNKFRFSAEGNPSVQLGAPQMPRGTPHKDEFFGETETYRRQVAIVIPAQGEGRFDLKVLSQGCADAGVCYVPMESQAGLRLVAWRAHRAAVVSQGPREVDAQARWSIFASDMDIAQLFQGNAALVLASFFGFGLLLSFTPCVLPMIPILGGIIAGEGKRPRQVARPHALGHLRAEHGAHLCARGRRGSLCRLAARRVPAERLGAGRVRRGVRAARAVDVRPLRASPAARAAASAARDARPTAGRSPGAGGGDGRAVGRDRQSLRVGAARRRAARRSPVPATWCSAARRCSPWHSAWACR
jgi:hypothetical protein